MEHLLFPAIHFVALMALIVYKAKTPFKNFMVSRHQLVIENIRRSEERVVEVETKKIEIATKLSNLESEKTFILQEWKQREAAQAKAIQEASDRLVSQMKIEAQRNRAALEEYFRGETLRGIGKQVLEQAEQKIKASLTAEKHQNINKRFAQELSVGA